MKYILIIVLIVLSVMVIIPPIHYQYVYPTDGDDTAAHLQYFQIIGQTKALYYGQYMVGKLLTSLPFDILTSFSLFHYIVLISVIWAVGLSVGLAINPLAGILASILLIGKTYLLELYHWGQIFDICSIAIFLPMAFLCLHKMNNGIGWKIGAVASLGLFAVFHANGIYIVAVIPIVVGYEIIMKLVSRKNHVMADKMKSYRFLVYTGMISIGLIIVWLTGIFTPEPMRQLMDASIIMAMFVCGLMGFYAYGKSRIIAIVMISVMILIALPTLKQWNNNGSAIKDADKDAIAYLNSLDGNTYTASPLVAQNIYGLFLNKKFQNNIKGADYVVDRTLPETPYSDPQSRFFKNRYRLDIMNDMQGYKVLKVFDNGETDDMLHLPLVVTVYGKDDDKLD